MSKLTKKGAQSVTADLDRLANLFQAEYETLGIPEKIAHDFAYRVDLLSDTIEKQAGVNREAYDAENIGREQTGPIETVDSDEPFMKGQFSQQENRELLDVVESGALSNSGTVDDPRNPTPGKQAGFESFGRQAAAERLDTAGVALNQAASKAPGHAAGLTRLASQVLSVKAAVLEGKASPDHVSRTLQAVRKLLPHVAAEKDDDEEEKKVAKLVSLASRVASGAEAPAHGYNLSA